MSVSVKIPTILRQHTGGEKTVPAEGETLKAVIASVDTAHPGLGGRLIAEDGGLHRFVNIYVDDEDVRFLGGLQAPVKDGQTVTILPAVAGGAGSAIAPHVVAGGAGSAIAPHVVAGG